MTFNIIVPIKLTQLHFILIEVLVFYTKKSNDLLIISTIEL